MARILVIEDNRTNLELMRTVLGGFGHIVSAASEGAEGIELALADPPDLILIDIAMPRVTGREVMQELRRSAKLHSVPMIAITALAMSGDRESLLADGFNGYLAKPVAPEKLIEAIDALLAPELRSVRQFPIA